MVGRVARTIERYGMFRAGQRVGVAVSGGADSVCLLHVLVELAPRWGLRLRVLHLNHNLRGDESRADAAFVADLARRVGAEAVIEEWTRTSSDNLEQAAREARLAFFGRLIEAREIDCVATGHTRSDQAETVLFRFLRGSGTAGLAAIRPVTREGVVRPLLDIDRSEVIAWLRERGIGWREDSTNAGLDFARNRIRHELLPALTAGWNPALAETLAHTAEWALGEEAYWEAEIDRLAETEIDRAGDAAGDAVILRADRLGTLPRAAARRLVRRAIECVKGDTLAIGFAHVERILELAASREGHDRMQAPGIDVLRSFELLRFARLDLEPPERNFRFPLAVPGTTPLRDGSLIVTELSPGCAAGDHAPNVLDPDCLTQPLELRNWRPGDQYQRAAASAPEKVKTLFQEARIPLWERRHWPVVTCGEEIVWVRRFGAAAKFAPSAASRAVLRIVDAHPGAGK